jgi:hypothetical protein
MDTDSSFPASQSPAKKNLCMTETTWTLFSKKKDNLGLVKRTIKETHSNRLKALL